MNWKSQRNPLHVRSSHRNQTAEKFAKSDGAVTDSEEKCCDPSKSIQSAIWWGEIWLSIWLRRVQTRAWYSCITCVLCVHCIWDIKLLRKLNQELPLSVPCSRMFLMIFFSFGFSLQCSIHSIVHMFGLAFVVFFSLSLFNLNGFIVHRFGWIEILDYLKTGICQWANTKSIEYQPLYSFAENGCTRMHAVSAVHSNIPWRFSFFFSSFHSIFHYIIVFMQICIVHFKLFAGSWLRKLEMFHCC